MKKVFIIHGFEGRPNGGWRPWLMGELEKQDIYACALPMPSPDKPEVSEWVKEVVRAIEIEREDEIYLVGHSLGATAILRYLENPQASKISGAVLVSGPIRKNQNRKIDNFLESDFDFEKIKSNCANCFVIHGNNDPYVPIRDAELLSENLNCELMVIQNGGHLNGSAGFDKLPECLEILKKIF